jgi:hypothetical protein
MCALRNPEIYSKPEPEGQIVEIIRAMIDARADVSACNSLRFEPSVPTGEHRELDRLE